MNHGGYVYILCSKWRRVLYTGVTSDLSARVAQHRSGEGKGFTARYRVHRLLYCERHDSIEGAIAREKQIKGGSRADKIKLIESMNTEWRDLSEDPDFRP